MFSRILFGILLLFSFAPYCANQGLLRFMKSDPSNNIQEVKRGENGGKTGSSATTKMSKEGLFLMLYFLLDDCFKIRLIKTTLNKPNTCFMYTNKEHINQ